MSVVFGLLLGWVIGLLVAMLVLVGWGRASSHTMNILALVMLLGGCALLGIMVGLTVALT